MKKILLVVFASLFLFTGYAENYTASQDLNVRMGSSSSAEVIGQITKSTVVDVTSIDGNWGKINFQGKDGYVSMKFLDKVVTESNSGEQTTTSTHTSSSSSTGTWFIVIIIIIIMLYFRNTSLVKLLFGAAGGIVKNAANSNSASNKSSNMIKKVAYRCHYCGTIHRIDERDTPSIGANCKNGKTHDWRRIN